MMLFPFIHRVKEEASTVNNHNYLALVFLFQEYWCLDFCNYGNCETIFKLT